MSCVYSIEHTWVDGYDIYCKFNDGLWKLDIRNYSQAGHPEIQYLINNPDVLANVGFDEDGWPEWPNGFAPDTDIFREEGIKIENKVENWELDNPMSLTLEQAIEIMEYKKRSTFRALTSKFLGYENQWEGSRLARDAFLRISGLSYQEFCELEFDERSPFCMLHKHNIGNFFWWE
jgi:hypothetical protein